MPIYNVQHHILLTPSQQDDLAAAITRIHSTKFSTPRMFVNVVFTDTSSTRTYIGGKQRKGNHIVANVRSGPSRTQDDWNEAAAQIAKAWDEIIGVGLPKVKRSDKEGVDTKLRSLIFLGGMIGGLEAGFVLPAAGQDVQWMHENWDAFQQKAREGDEEFAEMVQEVEERGLLGANGEAERDKRRQDRLEEMLGWGEHA
ncbi:hypothetical protein BAUCODRAFT_27894 [Baudoinia panamericana UAMH 10762]|uniref:Tautomerase cis-CaaD-like domain-containing protein n=1 Tax=Baudoinia panamericana (strain UAMH 10762) TaxID=717646 RepID=M2M4S9_BAUPA|nr:uncharacterized protein BAUCODRAFT_27894 [Baudoinia panamericana UAMH 10762]EMC91606.1 hypothetical protein BAUCODRAFT_27894 [Baudoinia panamericana UAMH 10762]